MAEELEIRELVSNEELREMSALLDAIWGKRRMLSPELLRAFATHGGEVIGAFRAGRLIGAQMGFLGRDGDETILHSHVTGVVPEVQQAGVGLELKRAQRDWCLARGIETVTWTFDPVVARNGYFNLTKLGAIAHRFYRDFYGEMDDALNRGERSDRLEVRWALQSERVEQALVGTSVSADPSEAAVVLAEVEGRPVPRPDGGDRRLVSVPEDYAELRERVPEMAAAWRDAVADALERALDDGLRATGFARDAGYLLER